MPHILLLRLFDEYNDEIWNAVTAMTPFHKLTYKFKNSDTMQANTNYQKIMEKL